ncbi:hypothetical protein V6Z11_A11G024700 [Gossypium hirsutum]
MRREREGRGIRPGPVTGRPPEARRRRRRPPHAVAGKGYGGAGSGGGAGGRHGGMESWAWQTRRPREACGGQLGFAAEFC